MAAAVQPGDGDRHRLAGWALVPLLAWGEVRHATMPVGAPTASGSRWATVFPLGMLAVATRAFAGPAGLPALHDVGDACFAVRSWPGSWRSPSPLTTAPPTSTPAATRDARGPR